jgi:hypothetical protein
MKVSEDGQFDPEEVAIAGSQVAPKVPASNDSQSKSVR